MKNTATFLAVYVLGTGTVPKLPKQLAGQMGRLFPLQSASHYIWVRTSESPGESRSCAAHSIVACSVQGRSEQFHLTAGRAASSIIQIQFPRKPIVFADACRGKWTNTTQTRAALLLNVGNCRSNCRKHFMIFSYSSECAFHLTLLLYCVQW